MSLSQPSSPVIARVRDSVVCHSYELALNRNHGLCMKHAVRTHEFYPQLPKIALFWFPRAPSEVLQWNKSKGGAAPADFKVGAGATSSICHMYVRVFLWLCGAARCHCQIMFPPLCAHVFVAIRHDVISPVPTTKLSLWEKQACSRSTQPCSRPCLISSVPVCPLITASHHRPLHAQNRRTATTAADGRRRWFLWVYCCCCCIKLRRLRGPMLTRMVHLSRKKLAAAAVKM